jgi:hypothetical protein
MTVAFRILRSLSIAAWFGALIFFVLVTIVAFRDLHDPHIAGIVVRGSLLSLHRLGMIAGGIYFILTLALLGTQRDSHPARAIELVLVVSMLALTAYSQFSIIPRMEADRIALGGDVNQGALDNPKAFNHFSRLHGLSEKLEGAILIEAMVLIALAPLHGREDYDRFA